MEENFGPHSRLDSWKDIARYLGRDVRTVIRWQEKGLPVHRVPGGKTVFAYRSEIDAWLNGKPLVEIAAESNPLQSGLVSAPGSPAGHSPLPTKHWKAGVVVLALLAAITGGAARTYLPAESIQSLKLTRLTRDGLFKMGLVSDGANLYFSELTEGKVQLSRMPLEGGAIARIPTPFARAFVEDVSSDGSELLVRGHDGTEQEGSLWIVSLRGRPPQKLGDILCRSAARSPDGRTIAYSHNNSIFVTTDEGATARELHQFSSEPYQLHWAKSADRLRFLLRNPTTTNFTPWEIPFPGRSPSRAALPFPFASGICCGGWTDVRGYNFFILAAREDNRIWALPEHHHWWQTSLPQTLQLATPLGTLSSLASDPRSGRLLVISAEPDRGEFIRFEPFAHTFSPFLPGIAGLYPDVARDGKWVAYRSLDDANLWISRMNGEGRRQLTSWFEEIELPRWSPDGTRIALSAKKNAQPWRIYLVNREGGPPREASSGSDNQGAPSWSPDGKQLIYANVNCGLTNACAIHRIDLATGHVDTIPGSAGLQTARWSPDGRYIAALETGLHRILLFDVARRRWRKLADSIVGDDLSWSSDSQALYSSRPIGDRPQIVFIPIAAKVPTRILDLAPLSKLSGKFDVGLCIAPDGSIILSRSINSSEIYAIEWQAH
jgi:Tol biopolymer transport system component